MTKFDQERCRFYRILSRRNLRNMLIDNDENFNLFWAHTHIYNIHHICHGQFMLIIYGDMMGLGYALSK